MTKKNNSGGVAENYAPINETLDLEFAKVVIADLVITYQRKNQGGRLTKDVLTKEYPSRHAVQVIVGRLRADNGAYLLRLMAKIESEKLNERLKNL